MFRTIQADAVYLTPNRRLSAKLHQIYHLQQQEKKKNVWETPTILPVNTWIEKLWNEETIYHVRTHHFLLNDIQEKILWEKIIFQTHDFFIKHSETVELVRSSYYLLKQWQVPLDHDQFNKTEESRALYKWIKDFVSLCQQHSWLDKTNLADILIKKISQEEIKPPSKMVLVGFNMLSPQLQNLFKTCSEKGSHIQKIESLSNIQATCQRITLPDEKSEITTIARFSKLILEKNNKATIGCVFPNLDTNRDKILQIFSQVFMQNDLTALMDQSPLFNLSAGKSLASYPVIKTALQLLALSPGTVSYQTLSDLLTNPFIGDSEYEKASRATFEKWLRSKNFNQINLSQLLDDQSNIPFNKFCPRLASRLQNFLARKEQIKNKLSYQEWAHEFNHLLSLVGWPGEQSLQSEGYQTVANWITLFANFMSLDQVISPINYQEALQVLQNLTKQHTYQVKTPDAPIQILGVLEAAALPFDYLWISGMNDCAWPPSPQPNPFIPKALQRQFAMPHATAEREFIYCEQLIKQFKQNASSIHFSFAKNDDEMVLEASPFIKDIVEISLDQLGLPDFKTTAETIFATRSIEVYTDYQAPALADLTKMEGGVHVIKDQAACPFKAFAAWRLHAKELEETSPGLRAKERGTIIHLLLQKVWSKLINHTTLIETTGETLSQIITSTIEEVCDQFFYNLKTKPVYLSLEKKRLTQLIQSWLVLEKNREPFTVIDQEKSILLQVGPLTLSCRIDRIDQLNDGHQFIIDYKTGQSNDLSGWFSERPEEPQLPLYAVFGKESVIGICFAQVNAHEHAFKGISQYDIGINGIKNISEIKCPEAKTWQDQLTSWRHNLDAIANDYAQGGAKVDPKQEQTCRWCKLKSLCRIHEEINLC